MNKIKTLEGKRFRKLLVVSRYREGSTTFYNCQCDCGKTTIVTHSNLKSGSTKSCGCLIPETRGGERKPLEDVIVKSILGAYKRNAKNRNYIWALEHKHFLSLIKGNCYYCGISPNHKVAWHYKYEKESLPFNGIDRVDNSIGYTTENCVSCCRTCNNAKNNLTIEEFKNWSERLYKCLHK
jgi:ribosomal protein S27E